MKPLWILSVLDWFRIPNASPSAFLHSIAETIKPGRVHGSPFSTSCLSIFALIVLSWFRDAVAGGNPIAYLVAPTIAWALLLLSSSTLLVIQARRQQSQGLQLNGDVGDIRWLTRDQICIAGCFLFTQICEVEGAGSVGSVWSYTLLPSAILLLRIWYPSASDQRKNSPAIVFTITTTATLLSFHCGTAFFGTSNHHYLLPVFKSVSLSVGLLLCEKLGSETSEVPKDFVELPQSDSLFALPSTTFLTQLRNVSLAVTGMLAAILLSHFVRSSVEISLTGIWRVELALALVEAGRWFVIFWMIWGQKRNAFAISLLFAGISTFELISQNRSQYVLVGELLFALVLHSLNLFDLFSLQRRQIYILFTLLCFIGILISLAFLPQRFEVQPMPPHGNSIHPIEQLIQTSQEHFSEIFSRQSQTLEEAIEVYKIRTGRHPPPKFDIWYTFAKERNVVLIDEFDTITDLLKPFWGLEPSLIRKYARDAIGAENTPYTAFLIRKGTVRRYMFGGWFADDLDAMLGTFVEHLPDMDLAFNYRDEPSVIVPHDLLAKLVEEPVSMSVHPIGNFSGPPSELVDEIRFHYGTPVIPIGRSTVWTQLIQSCPLDSPVRRTTDNTDLRASYAYDPLGFIYNKSASTEVCNQPSLPHLHGFFDRPDTMNYCSTLLPIFSVSKVSSFNDIIFPSPWHYSQVISVEEENDPEWEGKRNQLHWRGTTTTGYAVTDGWKNHHRHRLVSAFDNFHLPVSILRKQLHDGVWVKDTISSDLMRPYFDVKFTSISGSSTEEARLAQEMEYNIAEREDQQALWRYKYLLDVDGHGLSGRFYALMKSKSLVFKMSMFREWHDEWLFPWVHYIPLSLEGEDWFESVRYFEEDAKELAERIAGESRDWARRVLRKEDMEVWMFRLLLEYARVIDDARDSIGFEM